MKVCEEQAGDKVSENIMLAVLQKYLCDGELGRHLNLQSARLATYDLARKEAINYLRAKQTWTASGSSNPMDLSPLGKGKGGKKGKGKGKGDKSAKPKECFYCGQPGHNKNECRNFSAALRKKSVQPDKAGEVGVPNNVQTRCSNRAIRRSPTASGRRHESCSFRFQVPQHGCWYSENRRKVRREKRDKTHRCCWTGDG